MLGAIQGLDWVWEMLKLSLSAALPPRRDLPRILFYDQLDHMDKAAWLGLETALVVNDRSALCTVCLCCADTGARAFSHCSISCAPSMHMHWASVAVIY